MRNAFAHSLAFGVLASILAVPSVALADPITVVAHPNKVGSNLVLLFYATKADGTRLYRASHRYDGEKE